MNAASGQTENPENDGYCYISSEHFANGFKKLHAMQRQSKLCDIIVTVGEEVYRGHKNVFASMSEYFSDLFDEDGSEANSKVHIDDISPASFQSIIQFFYTGEIIISVANVEELLVASKRFKIESLETACTESMLKLLNTSTCIQIKAIAGAQHVECMQRKCIDYALQHFEDIVKIETFLQLSFCEVKELIVDHDLVVRSDEVVYSAVLQWVKYDLPNREPTLSELMACVKLPLIDKTYFMKSVASEPLMRDNFECSKLLLEATEYHSGMQCGPSSSRTLSRNCSLSIVVAGGGTGSYGTTNCEIYNPRTNTWHSFSSMQCKRTHHGLVGFRRLLYAFGGFDKPSTLSTVEYYNPLKNSWYMTTSLPHGRYAHGICSIDNAIYICGGRDQAGNYLNSVDKFDPITAAYMTYPPMNTSRSYFNMAVSDNCIYAIGGDTDGGQDLKAMEILDPREGKWSEAPSKSIPGIYQSVAVLNGFIYTAPRAGVLGCDWEQFNIRKNAWEHISNTSIEQDHLNHDGCLYILGSCITSMQKYNPKENSVIQMPPMINKRDYISAVMMDSIEIKDVIKINDS